MNVKLIYFVIGTMLLTAIVYGFSLFLTTAIISWLPIAPSFPYYENFPRILQIVVLFLFCIPLVYAQQLSIPKHILLALTFGSLALALLIAYPRVKNPNKVYIFNTMALILGIVGVIYRVVDLAITIQL